MALQTTALFGAVSGREGEKTTDDVDLVRASMAANLSRFESVSAYYTIQAFAKRFEDGLWTNPYEYTEKMYCVYTSGRYYVRTLDSTVDPSRIRDYTYDRERTRVYRGREKYGYRFSDYGDSPRSSQPLWSDFGLTTTLPYSELGNGEHEVPLATLLSLGTFRAESPTGPGSNIVLVGYLDVPKKDDYPIPWYILTISKTDGYMPVDIRSGFIAPRERLLRMKQEGQLPKSVGTDSSLQSIVFDQITYARENGYTQQVSIVWGRIGEVWLPREGQLSSFASDKEHDQVAVSHRTMRTDWNTVDLNVDLGRVPFGDEIWPDGTSVADLDLKHYWVEGDPLSLVIGEKEPGYDLRKLHSTLLDSALSVSDPPNTTTAPSANPPFGSPRPTEAPNAGVADSQSSDRPQRNPSPAKAPIYFSILAIAAGVGILVFMRYRR